MTEQQKTAMTITAKKVMSDKKQMPVTEMINRLRFITGKDMSKCIEGYRWMRQEKFIPDEFVSEKKEVEDALMKTFLKSDVSLLLDKFDCIMHDTEKIHELTKPEPKQKPHPVSIAEVATNFDLQVNF